MGLFGSDDEEKKEGGSGSEAGGEGGGEGISALSCRVFLFFIPPRPLRVKE